MVISEAVVLKAIAVAYSENLCISCAGIKRSNFRGIKIHLLTGQHSSCNDLTTKGKESRHYKPVEFPSIV